MQQGRYVALDGIRGLAALYVVFFHTTWLFHGATSHFVRNGYLSVDLFFILSGFIISANYAGKIAGPREAGDFLRKRFFRVYPLHLAVIGALVCLELVKLAASFAGRSGAQEPFTGNFGLGYLLLNVLFLQGTGIAAQTSWNPPSWSVSSEFVAYILFAIAGVVGLLKGRLVQPALAIAGLLGYLGLALSFDTLDLTYDYGIVRCLCGFAVGMGIYDLRSRSAFAFVKTMSPLALSIVEVLTLAATLLALSITSGPPAVIAVFCFALLVTVYQFDGGIVSRLLGRPWPQELGRISYSLYLVHVPIRLIPFSILSKIGAPAVHADGGRTILETNLFVGDLALIGFIGLALAVSAVSYRFIEEPARLFGRRRRALPVPAGAQGT